MVEKLGRDQRITRNLQRWIAGMTVALSMAYILPAAADSLSQGGPSQGGNPAASAATISGTFGVVEQTISVPFRPVSVFALLSSPSTHILQYHAVAVPMTPGATEVEVGQTVTVGATVPIPKNAPADEAVYFTFFLVNLNGEFAATEVQSWTWGQLSQNNRSIDELNQDRAQIEHDIPLQREENNKLDARLTQLREQASKIAEVDGILDLKTELANLKDFDERKVGDLERLKYLYHEGVSETDPTDDGDIRMNLLAQMRKAAQVTADADRLGMSRKETATNEFHRKLNLIRGVSDIDPQQLAKQILALRKQRRELESRLNMNSTPESTNQEF
jgi:hypothetical protein